MFKNTRLALLLAIFILASAKSINLVRIRNSHIDLPTNTLKINSGENAPVSLNLERLGVSLPITKASINEGNWEYTNSGVSYLSTTPLPGNTGNAVFYGHNWPNILGKLSKLNKGDKMIIYMSNGEARHFQMDSKYIVTPDQTHILTQTEDSKVTLYTCTGFLDSKRLVTVFTPIQ